MLNEVAEVSGTQPDGMPNAVAAPWTENWLFGALPHSNKTQESRNAPTAPIHQPSTRKCMEAVVFLALA